jgi:ubiquitin C-terminal hydrolase
MDIDSSDGISDNQSNNDNDDGTIVVDMAKREPLNDPNCEHFFIKDEDTIGNSQAWICRKCKRGTFIPKHMSITNSS